MSQFDRTLLRLGVIVPLLIPGAMCAQTPHGVPADSGYRLAWSDEFNGTALDETQWNYRTDTKYSSKQLPSNVSVRDGLLRIALTREPGAEPEYRGGGVITTQTFHYGFYEASIKIEAGSGWHSSFWMMKYNGSDTKPQRATVELDALENQSVSLRSYGVNTHRWLGTHITKGHKDVDTPDLSEGFHIFGCDYQPDKITYYFDSQPVQTVDWSGEPQGEQNIWLTSIAEAMGPRHDIDATHVPGLMSVDWVRFYKKTESASPVPSAAH